MEAVATIRFSKNPKNNLRIQLTPLEAIRVVASRYGYDDLDVMPEVYGYKIVASAGFREVSGKGPTQEAACEDLFGKIT